MKSITKYIKYVVALAVMGAVTTALASSSSSYANCWAEDGSEPCKKSWTNPETGESCELDPNDAKMPKVKWIDPDSSTESGKVIAGSVIKQNCRYRCGNDLIYPDNMQGDKPVGSTCGAAAE